MSLESMKFQRRELMVAAMGSLLLGSTTPSQAQAASTSKPLLRAPRLKPGDTIGLVNPSNAIYERQPYEMAAETLQALGFKVRSIRKVTEGRPNAVDLLKNGEVQWVINTPLGRDAYYDESAIRRESLRLKIPCLTNMSAALAACEAVETLRGELKVRALQGLQSAPSGD